MPKLPDRVSSLAAADRGFTPTSGTSRNRETRNAIAICAQAAKGMSSNNSGERPYVATVRINVVKRKHGRKKL